MDGCTPHREKWTLSPPIRAQAVPNLRYSAIQYSNFAWATTVLEGYS
jgi:hypothetical protein